MSQDDLATIVAEARQDLADLLRGQIATLEQLLGVATNPALTLRTLHSLVVALNACERRRKLTEVMDRFESIFAEGIDRGEWLTPSGETGGDA